MRKSIYQQYKKLMGSHSQSANCYTVINVPFSKTHKLGVGIDDRPMFFIRSSITDNSPNINLELITVQFNELCRLKKDTESKFVNENHYTVITLKSKQIDYIEYFLDVVCIVLEKLGDFPSQQDLLNEIQKLVELFRRFSRPPIKTIQGLWAELFVIEHSSNPSYLVKSWHTTTSDIFDFNDGTDKLEVKSTSRINRVHRFSHNQLTPNESSIVVIASLCVQQSGVGKTVLDLMDAIEPNLENAELRFQLADMISKTLGSDFEKACEYCFDYALACDTYQKYNCKDIPSLDNSSIPAEISDIHYDCDLSKVTPLGVPSEIFPNSKLIKSL